MYGTEIFRVKHLAFTICTLSVIALVANLVYKIFFAEVAIRVHEALALEYIGLIEFSTGTHLVLTIIKKTRFEFFESPSKVVLRLQKKVNCINRAIVASNEHMLKKYCPYELTNRGQNHQPVIIILYAMLSVVNLGLGLELVYMFGVAGNVQVMFIASLITLVEIF